jgi:hypothetical protein
MFDPAGGMALQYLGLETENIRILAEHGEFVSALEIRREEKGELALRIDAATRTKIVRLVDAMKAAATGADHSLEVRFRRALADAEKGDVVDH